MTKVGRSIIPRDIWLLEKLGILMAEHSIARLTSIIGVDVVDSMDDKNGKLSAGKSPRQLSLHLYLDYLGR